MPVCPLLCSFSEPSFKYPVNLYRSRSRFSSSLALALQLVPSTRTMCYIDGSIDQATTPCPMCKVFRPATARCVPSHEHCASHIQLAAQVSAQEGDLSESSGASAARCRPLHQRRRSVVRSLQALRCRLIMHSSVQTFNGCGYCKVCHARS